MKPRRLRGTTREKKVSAGLARKLAGDNTLHFVEAPALQPPEFQIDEATKTRYEQELAAAAAQPLPEDDDDDL